METPGGKNGGETRKSNHVSKRSYNCNLMACRLSVRCWLCGLFVLWLAGWQGCRVKEVLNWMRSSTQDVIS
jgi:hypothetical protein